MPNNSSTSGAAAAAAQQTQTTYSTKWGTITILNRDNYAAFHATCQSTLLTAGAWSIVKGTDKGPITLDSPDVTGPSHDTLLWLDGHLIDRNWLQNGRKKYSAQTL
jgi:hypothetical protein